MPLLTTRLIGTWGTPRCQPNLGQTLLVLEPPERRYGTRGEDDVPWNRHERGLSPAVDYASCSWLVSERIPFECFNQRRGLGMSSVSLTELAVNRNAAARSASIS